MQKCRDHTEEKNKTISYLFKKWFLWDFHMLIVRPSPSLTSPLPFHNFSVFGHLHQRVWSDRQWNSSLHFCFFLLVSIKYFLDEKVEFNVKNVLFFMCRFQWAISFWSSINMADTRTKVLNCSVVFKAACKQMLNFYYRTHFNKIWSLVAHFLYWENT